MKSFKAWNEEIQNAIYKYWGKHCMRHVSKANTSQSWC